MLVDHLPGDLQTHLEGLHICNNTHIFFSINESTSLLRVSIILINIMKLMKLNRESW